MTEDEFREKYPALSAELYVFESPGGRSDEQVASLQLSNEARNSLVYRLAAVEGVLEDSRRLLARFESDGAAFAAVTNRKALKSPDAAKDWLVKMTDAWERVLEELRKLPD